jgi:hypothetical protein
MRLVGSFSVSMAALNDILKNTFVLKSLLLFLDYNKRTGVSTWSRPKVLKDVDLKITPRSRSLAVANGVTVIEEKVVDLLHPNAVMQHHQKKHKERMSEERAVLLIQGLYRSRVARKRLCLLCASVYEKVFDEASGKFFCKFYYSVAVFVQI